jgi:hypothetical protein
MGILKTILEAILGFFTGYAEKKLLEISERKAKVEAGKMKSVVRTKEIEQKIKMAKPAKRSLTPSDWNRKAGGAGVILLLVFLTSCVPIFIESRWPIIEVPARPALPEHPPEFTKREVILVDYAEELEVKVRTYNMAAEDHNKESGYEE